jgi:DnaJ-class molecular chaperone
MPDLRRKGTYGDLMAKVRIRVPEDLGQEERQLFEKLAAIHKTEAE